MDLKGIVSREITTEDYNDILDVEKQAFGYDKEAKLVAELLTDKSAEPIVSLLAFHGGQAVGHILFYQSPF